MRHLLLLVLVGFVAQLVDGSLGMGYGVLSSSFLLLTGLSPALTSASVHLAEIGTSLVVGSAHHRLGNTDWHLVARLGGPGAVGAFIGATALSHLSTRAATPVTSSILLALGVYVLLRFTLRPPAGTTARRSGHGARFTAPLGLIAGLVDATGGGGWGPVATTTLLTAGKTAPRTVVGSVDTSQFIVSVAASLGFLLGLGHSGIPLTVVAALLVGGMVAAPLAAWLVSRLPGQVLGSAVGGLIILTNLAKVLGALGTGSTATLVVLAAVVPVWLLLVAVSVRRWRHERLLLEAAHRAGASPAAVALPGARERAAGHPDVERVSPGRRAPLPETVP